jgi:tetratricopeptide (TPR) repeat protein
MKKILITLTLIACTQWLLAQNVSFEQLNEKAYFAYINSNMFLWKQIASEADKILDLQNGIEQDQIKAIKLKYGLIYSCLSNQDETSYNTYIDKTIEQLDILMKKYPNSSDLYSISAAIMSVQMAFSPAKGMTLGSQSGKHISKALELDSSSALAWRQDASSKYFTPKMWGGDINQAIQEFEKAIQLFEAQNQTKDWVYLDAMAWLGIAYSKTGQKDKAKEIFEKALQIEPNFTWVKNSLLPSVLKSS